MEKYTVDRIIEGIAVLLWRKDETVQLDIPIDQLPEGVKEGDMLHADIKDGNVIKAKIDKTGTEKQKKKIEDKLKRLLEKNR